MSKCIVTGAAGFIGSHLCEALLLRGHDVIGLDMSRRNSNIEIMNHNLAPAMGLGLTEWFVGAEFFPREYWQEAEYVFHLAALPGVQPSWTRLPDYMRTNVELTGLILDMLRESSALKRFILTSSSSIYGETDGRVSESNPTIPLSPYGVSKLAQERLAWAMGKANQLPLIILRLFSVYGPRQRPDMAFSTFIRKMWRGEPLSLYNADSRRDYTYVGDVVNALILAMEQGHNGQAYNIGRGEPVALSIVVAELGNIMGQRPDLIDLGPRAGDPPETWANNLWARRELGWSPKMMWPEGLALQVADMEANRGLYDAL